MTQFTHVLLMAVFAIILATGRVQAQQSAYPLPHSPAFDRWIWEQKGQPPAFDSLRPSPFIQDPLMVVRDGIPHRVTAGDWPERRAEIAGLLETWLLGHAPEPPGNVRCILKNTTMENGRAVWNVMLEFGPDHRAALNCKLYLPNGDRPAPVFLCDSEFYLQWATGAMEKGFAACVYDAKDFQDGSLAYKGMFGDYDWSDFRRRGWSASRVIDWLETLDFIDAGRIMIGGHSRSAKQAITAAAFDSRISAIIVSSPGSGGSPPLRYCDGSYFGESLELLTRYFPNWVIPKARYFSGRENLLPCDTHFLYAMIAPRPMLMGTGINDHVEHTWAVEQIYKTIQPVYATLGKPENIALRYRPGGHSPDAETMRAYSDFLLVAAGMEPGTAAQKFPFTPFHVWDYATWERDHPSTPNISILPELRITDPTIDESGKRFSQAEWPQRRDAIRRNLASLLGDGPDFQPMPVDFNSGESLEAGQRLHRGWKDVPTVTCRFGDGINGNLYYPSADLIGGSRKLPAIIWLAPFGTAAGYARNFHDRQIVLGFSKLGTPVVPTGDYQAGRIVYRNTEGDNPADRFVTFAFDPIGTGGRQEERRDFYTKYPQWSLMGKMVQDARHAIDVLKQRPDIDPDRIYLVGYAMGGMTAVMAAALDDRMAGVVSVAGFTPFRTDTDEKGAGGVRRYSHLYGWIPRLGAFVGAESKIPVDFHEMLACIAPRYALVMAPKGDWHATHADVVQAVDMARSAYRLLGAESKLILNSPNDWNRFTDELQTQVVFRLNSWVR